MRALTVRPGSPGSHIGSAEAFTPAPRKAAWSWPHYLAILGVPILVWEVWTLTAWLADGPRQITEFRDHDSLNWYLARFYEGLALAVAVPMLVYIVRGCRRARTIFTFDVMFVICGTSMFWLDQGINFFQPGVLMSSNWVNVNNPCGHMPFVVNPDCGRVPEPILLALCVEGLGMLALAVVAGRLVQWARQRQPGISTAKLLGLLVLFAVGIEIAFEIPIIASGLWTYTGGPSIPLGSQFRYALPEIIGGAAVFFIVAIRVFKDDKGRTFVERGLDGMKPRRAKLVMFLALYFVVQFLADGFGNIVALSGPYSPKWPEMPAYVVNDVCDAPGITGTRYGPCPGSPEYRMPGRQSKLGPGAL